MNLMRIDWVAVDVVVLVVAVVGLIVRHGQLRRQDRTRQRILERENFALRVLLRELGVSVSLTQTAEQIDIVAKWRTGAPADWTVPRAGERRH